MNNSVYFPIAVQYGDGYTINSIDKMQRIEIQSTDNLTTPKPLTGTFVNLNGISVYDGPENEARTDYSFGDPIRAKRVKRA